MTNETALKRAEDIVTNIERLIDSTIWLRHIEDRQRDGDPEPQEKKRLEEGIRENKAELVRIFKQI